MTEQKDIYCDLGFWRDLSNKLSTAKPLPDPEENKKLQLLTDWYDLICRSNKYFVCPIKDFETATDNDWFLKHIWKSSTDGRCRLEFDERGISKMLAGPAQMDSIMYNALFLTKDNYNDVAKKEGVINVCSKELFEFKELFSDQGEAIQRKDANRWSLILKAAKVSHNCNAMVVVDNYIFEEKQNNLYEILDTILPKCLDVVFYLTVFFFNNGSERTVEGNKRALETKIKEIRPELSAKIEVFGINEKFFHDRALITNYLWCGVGSGFDLISQQKTDKSTELHVVYPMIIPEDRIKWSNKRYHILIDDAKKCLRVRGERSSNRLLR